MHRTESKMKAWQIIETLLNTRRSPFEISFQFQD